MIVAIVPQFFSSDLEKTLHFYNEKLGFKTKFKYGNPIFYAGATRDGHSIYFRHTADLPPTAPNKYGDELLDSYFIVSDIQELYREYSENAVEFHREISEMPWNFTEFVVRDVDGRLLCFGQSIDLIKN